LIEAMPVAIGILESDTLNTVNSAFAYAFGYRSPAELIEAGGLDAILPGGIEELRGLSPRHPVSSISALSRSRRRLSVTFMVAPLDEAAGLQLLRLVDPSDLDTESSSAEAAAEEPSQDAAQDLSQTTDLEAAADPIPEAMELGNAPKSTEPAQNVRTDLDPPKASIVDSSDPVSAADSANGEVSELRARARHVAAGQLDFLAKVSHEVRTPLNSIIGFAELMLHERFGPIGNTRYKGYAEDIHQSGLYALSLLNDLLDISKIEAGKFELDFTSVDVAEVVEACVTSLQPLAKRTRIVLRTSFADDLPLVLADPRRLRQILLNLLTNAIKFTREGGQVIVSGTMVGRELRLRVHDSGVGMSEDDIAYAMQPFHQLDTAPRHQSGTGLGLPLTKALTDAIRARLELKSEPGIGTSADIIFPKERIFRR
jgi:signal transduction histidine kinase